MDSLDSKWSTEIICSKRGMAFTEPDWELLMIQTKRGSTHLLDFYNLTGEKK